MKALSHELQLVISCSARHSKQKTFIHLTQQQTTDWELFLSLLHRHRVLPMAYHNFKKWQFTCPISAKLQQQYYQQTAKTLQQTATLIEIDKLFKQHGIDCVHFKGPTLSKLLYDDIALRQSKDIDILIQRKDIDKATKLLQDNEFCLLTKPYKKNYLNQRYRKWYKDYSFQKGFCNIELHWSLGYYIDEQSCQKIFNNAVSIDINHNLVSIPNNNDYLYYLILHGVTSAFARLHWLVDVVDCIRFKDIDKPKLLTSLHTNGYKKVAATLEDIITNTYQQPFTLCNKKNSKKIVAALCMRCLQNNDADKPHSLAQLTSRIQQKTNRFLLIEKFKLKMQFLQRFVLTNSADWYLLSLAKPLFFLYYILKPLFLFAREKHVFSTSKTSAEKSQTK